MRADQVTDAMIEAVEDECGVGRIGWDCCDPAEIVAAAFNVLSKADLLTTRVGVTSEVVLAAVVQVCQELESARENHAPMNSAHEAYAVLLEEVDEFWDEVKKKRSERDRVLMRRELVQVAAMAVRAIIDLDLPR